MKRGWLTLLVLQLSCRHTSARLSPPLRPFHGHANARLNQPALGALRHRHQQQEPRVFLVPHNRQPLPQQRPRPQASVLVLRNPRLPLPPRLVPRSVAPPPRPRPHRQACSAVDSAPQRPPPPPPRRSVVRSALPPLLRRRLQRDRFSEQLLRRPPRPPRHRRSPQRLGIRICRRPREKRSTSSPRKSRGESECLTGERSTGRRIVVHECRKPLGVSSVLLGCVGSGAVGGCGVAVLQASGR